jgi:LPS sulfotransferase NodH
MWILADEDREWRLFLAKNGVAPMSISYEQLCTDPSGFVAAIARRLCIDPHTLRQGYREPIAPSHEDDPALPSKSEVIRRYLAAVRQIHGAAAPRKLPVETPIERVASQKVE